MIYKYKKNLNQILKKVNIIIINLINFKIIIIIFIKLQNGE